MPKFSYTYINEITTENVQLKIEIISVIVSTLPAIVFELESQLDKMDFEAISKIAHKLKSSCKMLGMDNTLPTLLFLEESDLEKLPNEKITDAIELVTSDFNEVLNQLDQDLDELEQNS